MYLPMGKAETILKLLVEGMSISSIERFTEVHHTTILKLLVVAGERCERLLEEKVRGAKVDDVQADEIVEAVPVPRIGSPDPDRICTSHVERQNLSMRMGIRRLTRLTNGFSKKWENHKAALALWFAFYNFCRVHKSLRVTPAMEAGIADRVWGIAELLA